MNTTAEDEELRARALASLKKKREFGAHMLAYVLINTMLIVIWAMTGAGFFWPIFPLMGWGVGVFFNAWDVYSRGPSEERIRREIQSMR